MEKDDGANPVEGRHHQLKQEAYQSLPMVKRRPNKN